MTKFLMNSTLRMLRLNAFLFNFTKDGQCYSLVSPGQLNKSGKLIMLLYVPIALF